MHFRSSGRENKRRGKTMILLEGLKNIKIEVCEDDLHCKYEKNDPRYEASLHIKLRTKVFEQQYALNAVVDIKPKYISEAQMTTTEEVASAVHVNIMQMTAAVINKLKEDEDKLLDNITEMQSSIRSPKPNDQEN